MAHHAPPASCRPYREEPVRSIRLAIAAALVTLCAGCGADRPAKAEGDAPRHPAKPSPLARDVAVPVGRRVQLEGLMPRGEWEDALWRPLGDDGTLLALKQVQGTLLVGVKSPHAWPERGSLWLLFAPDGEDSGLYVPSAVRLDFEPREHNRPHLLVSRREAMSEQLVEDLAVVRASTQGAQFSVEVAMELRLLGLREGSEAARRFALIWMRGPGRPTVTWPAGLQVGGGSGTAPIDLASSARWARLHGWEDLDGPGALSRSDWARLHAEDRELTARGREAHALGLAIAEEAMLPKRDDEQVPELLGNLRLIAEREPLTAYDLFVLSKAYRFWNRPDEALAILDALNADAAWRGSDRVLYEKAVTLQSMERFEEAAAVWASLARSVSPQMAERYGRMAEIARERHSAWTAERAAREADRARADLPLVLLRTNRGDIVIQLFADDVPEAAKHFLSLAETREGDGGFYDGLLFHRVIGDFMAQAGDPQTREDGCEVPGSGVGPYTVPIERNARHGFWRGAVAFARGMRPANGSQFFILVSPRPDLEEQEFTVFGHVLAGLDVVDRLEQCDRLLEVRVLHGGGEGGR